jgi:Glycosyl transferase family 11
MIVVRLLGGLGNQLFQYALGRHLSLIHKRPLKFDTTYFTAQTPDAMRGIRVFGLAAFSLDVAIASDEVLREFSVYRGRRVTARFARLGSRWVPLRYRRYIGQRRADFWRFHPSILTSTLSDSVLIEGYWQSEKYFEGISQIIRNDLRLQWPPSGKNAELLAEISATNSVSVHVRHGDNANGMADELGVLSLRYYSRAKKLILDTVDKPRFFVFSDDPAWARENIRVPAGSVFVTHNGDEQNFEDLRLMAACKHHINGNSSFSWWGAWLGKKPGQIVIAPEKYLLGAVDDYRDYYPSAWTLLPVNC